MLGGKFDNSCADISSHNSTNWQKWEAVCGPSIGADDSTVADP